MRKIFRTSETLRRRSCMYCPYKSMFALSFKYLDLNAKQSMLGSEKTNALNFQNFRNFQKAFLSVGVHTSQCLPYHSQDDALCIYKMKYFNHHFLRCSSYILILKTILTYISLYLNTNAVSILMASSVMLAASQKRALDFRLLMLLP